MHLLTALLLWLFIVVYAAFSSVKIRLTSRAASIHWVSLIVKWEQKPEIEMELRKDAGVIGRSLAPLSGKRKSQIAIWPRRIAAIFSTAH